MNDVELGYMKGRFDAQDVAITAIQTELKLAVAKANKNETEISYLKLMILGLWSAVGVMVWRLAGA